MSDNRDVQAEQENTVDQTVAKNAEEAWVKGSQAEGVELDENAQRIYELDAGAQAKTKEQQRWRPRARRR